MKKVIVTGATGMVGKGILLECLDHKEISEVLVIGRKSAGISHQKLKELIHNDFTDFSKVKDQLSGYDACFFALGISAAGLSEEQYKRITYDFTMALAKTLFPTQPANNIQLCLGCWNRFVGKRKNDVGTCKG